MLRVRTSIELRQGVRVDLLCTPRLYYVAKTKGISLKTPEAEDGQEQDKNADTAAVTEVYVKMIYCAAVNAWEVDSVGDPEAGGFAYTYADFHEWAWSNRHELRNAIDFLLVAFTGNDLNSHANKALKKKRLLSR